MTNKEAIAWLWDQKRKGCEMFMHAELAEPATFDPENEKYTMPAGTPVLVTMISRFGHVCLRCRNIEEIRHGYDLGLDPNKLTNYRIAVQQETGR